MSVSSWLREQAPAVGEEISFQLQVSRAVITRIAAAAAARAPRPNPARAAGRGTAGDMSNSSA
jgi:hypothetical protein